MQKEMSALYRAAIWNNTASLAVVDGASLIRSIAARHALSDCAAEALGRVLTCAAYLCGWIEEDEQYSLIINGNGLLGKIHAFGNGALKLCGSIERDVAQGMQADITECVGAQGYLSVVRSGGKGLPFTGTCALAEGDVTKDIAAYFAESEQRPTAVCLYQGGGVFVQPLTGADESVLLRAQEAVKRCRRDMTAREILTMFGAEGAEEREITFGCTCSREKAERAVLSAGEEVARAVVESEGALRVHCHECNSDYCFGEKDINALFEK